ncbi:elongation factor P [Parvularcula sp. LCG005]|uniref:elongation factor P n=1 Tax=Parvularcula sp. LCG005 TaxID=3078805 RepID=UPI002942F229|nr:elongation factor P [Parvularcula sp. LCG005]WOI53009.1 elongation factor P [Parvularcula sp. LCG005]
MVKVIASNVRKGNVLEQDGGQLYVVLKAETFRPGKGTPTTTIEMRRISDGVKTVITTKTGEGLERAFVEDVEHTYLYDDGDNHIFMHPETFDQVAVPPDMIGDQVAFLEPEMKCYLKMFDNRPVAIELPARVTFEITETEPVVKGQTASSSYKPAMLSNGVRIMVPPHIDAGTRVVINTEDNSYVERAKD